MLWPWQKRQSIRELESKITNIIIDQPQVDIRQKIKILVIDDKEFTPKANLSRNGYNITHFEDISSVREARDFDLILVDLKGVGLKLDPEHQGAFLIKEIKASYPGKIVIAYTGGAMDELMAMAVKHADKYLQKDVAIDEWCDLLDDSIRDLAHPVDVWKNARKRLLDCGVTPQELADIEHYYVKGFTGSEIDLQALIQHSKKINISSDARALVQGVASNAAFNLISAGLGG